MPGVPSQGGALNFSAYPRHVPGEQCFDGNHADQNPKRVGVGQFMRGANQVDAFRGDADGGRNHGYPHHRGGDRVRLAMPVGMILIRRLDGQPQPPVDDRRTDDIEEGFNSIGQQRKRMPDEPGQAFDQRQSARLMTIASREERRPPFTICSVVGEAVMAALSLISAGERSATVPEWFSFLESDLAPLGESLLNLAWKKQFHDLCTRSGLHEPGSFLGRALRGAYSRVTSIVQALQAREASVAALFEARSHLRTLHHTGALGTDRSVLLPRVQQLQSRASASQFSGRAGHAGAGHTADSDVVSPGKTQAGLWPPIGQRKASPESGLQHADAAAFHRRRSLAGHSPETISASKREVSEHAPTALFWRGATDCGFLGCATSGCGSALRGCAPCDDC